jgi:hypothetical protein
MKKAILFILSFFVSSNISWFSLWNSIRQLRILSTHLFTNFIRLMMMYARRCCENYFTTTNSAACRFGFGDGIHGLPGIFCKAQLWIGENSSRFRFFLQRIPEVQRKIRRRRNSDGDRGLEQINYIVRTVMSIIFF